MSDDAFITEIEEALRDQRLEVEPVDEGLKVSQGTGVMAHETRVDPGRLAAELADDDRVRHRQIAGWVRGVKHVLLEPSRSDAADWSFVDSAGGLVPSIEIPTFSAGVEAAAGTPAWSLEFTDDLIVTYFIELDRGLRVLTDAQTDRWGVTDDRITSGARSKLFNDTRDLDFTPFEDAEYVHRLRAGDGHDAARCFVVADAFYTELDDGFRFAIPTPEHFLCVFEAGDETLEELSELARSIYDDADAPLTTDIFAFDTGTPVISQESTDE